MFLIRKKMLYSESLKKTRDFQQVYRRGTSVAERQFVMYALKNGSEKNRLGISVSKKVGNSIVRHRISRLIREAYRLQETGFSRGMDIVVVARISAAGTTQEETKKEIRRLGRRLHIWEDTE